MTWTVQLIPSTSGCWAVSFYKDGRYSGLRYYDTFWGAKRGYRKAQKQAQYLNGLGK